MNANAQALADEKLGFTAAKVEKEQGVAKANVISETAKAEEERGLMEAKILHEKLAAEAKGIEEKATAMKKLDGVGKEHEEFKLELEKEKEIELAQINIQKDIASAQAQVIAEALKASNIDIVGGETMFFEQIVGAITKGKKIDRLMENSETLTMVRDTFFNSDNGSSFKKNLRSFIDQFGLKSEDVKNLSLSQLLMNMANKTDDQGTQSSIGSMLHIANGLGLANMAMSELDLF